MSVWGRIFAAGYDRFLAAAERRGLTEVRRRVVGQATGRVLEIGAGTGLNLAHYGPGAVELVLTEPEAPMASRLRRKLSSSGRTAEVVVAPGERLPFPDQSFDAAVSTLVLCTVPEPLAALAELRRVLRPGAPLLFAEHVRADEPGLAAWQDRLHPLWVRFGHGCHCNRDTLSAITQAGFRVQEVRHGRIAGAPPIVRPLIEGRALAPEA